MNSGLFEGIATIELLVGSSSLSVRCQPAWSIKSQILNRQEACGAGGEGHPPGDAAALLGRRQDPGRAGGLRGEDSIAELRRKEGIAQSLYYTWSKEFMEAGKRRLAGDTARAATTDEVKNLRREAGTLKECVADLTLENHLLKRSILGDGGNGE